MTRYTQALRSSQPKYPRLHNREALAVLKRIEALNTPIPAYVPMAPVSPSRAGVGSPDGHHTGTLGVSRRINIVKGTGDGCMKELDLRVYSGESIQAVMDRARRQLPASKFETTLRKILLSQDIAVFEAPVHSVSQATFTRD